MEGRRAFLIDATALAYRSFFAFIRNPLINSKGINTSGVFGFVNTLLKILRDEKPDYIACIFDTAKPTFRHKTYPQYKATREKMPEELAQQLPVIRQVVEAFRMPLLELEGYEADDVMGTLARRAEKEGIEVYLVTGDKDLMQLVSGRVKMYMMGRGRDEAEILDPGGVEQKMGVPPERITDLLGLMGDSSDNIPGVPGIGPKTALKLLKDHTSLEGVLSNRDKLERKKLADTLKEFAEQARLSRDLATIRTQVPIEASLEALRVREMDRDRVIHLFKELEFSRFLREIPEFMDTPADELVRKYKTVQTLEELKDLAGILRKAPYFSVDLETTSLDPMMASLVGLSFSWKEGEAAYVPVRFPKGTEEGDLLSLSEADRLDRVLAALKPLLENSGIAKCGQNIKYDMLVLKRHGVLMQGVDFDSMVAAYLINPTARQFGIDALALEYLNIKKIPTSDLIGSGKNQMSMASVPLKRVAEYACEDADVAYRLRICLEPRIKEYRMEELFSGVEMPLVRVMMEMEESGVALDTGIMAAMSSEIDTQLSQLQEEIYEVAGERFNINSPQQLGTVLFEKLKVHEILGTGRPRKTKTGYSTDVRVLESLSGHPLPEKVLDYRQLMKLKSTYVDALPRLILPETGRVHASFNQTVTATGRISTSNPNLQNIPIRTELGREIRRAFVPGQKGWELVSADYSQIELRIMAHLSEDRTLISSFKKGEDVHQRTAVEIFGLTPGQVTAEHRRQAKTINFGIMYGMGAYGLAQRLGIPVAEAQDFINAYFARYPQVNAYIARTIGQAYKQGYVTTLLNRRRYLPELKSENRNVREFGERTAVNTPIQGTAADLIKVAMVHIADALRKPDWKSRMILQIHDELVFESPGAEVEALTKMIRAKMERAIELRVPVRVDIGVGKSWFEAH
jgi:DNA polymerase-1